MTAIRTRIAPSPTGYFHIGTARTALFNYLFAKRQGGTFVLRIEDTDLERSDPEYGRDIFEALDWLGIAADESPLRGGEYGPYRQSERIASYRPYLEQLVASGQAYHCPHTETELEAEKKALMAGGKNPVHVCEYRDGGTAPAAGGIIRFRTPDGRHVAFADLIRGEISFESDLLGDFSIAKDLSIPLYNFAVTIDDHEMAISHVIRGEDHISNTPKQLLIAEALGFPPPAYAHLPLILGPDRAKLSKRHGATAIREFRDQGYLPEAILNFMALLGWNPGDDLEIFSLKELIEHFDLAKVQKSGAIFNGEKLDWMNGGYIRRRTPAELAALIRPYLGDVEIDTAALEKIAALEQPRLKKLSDLKEQAGYFFLEPEYPTDLLRWKQMGDDEIRASLEQTRDILAGMAENDFTREGLEARLFEVIGKGDKGKILWPLRVALTGKRASPGPFEILEILGKNGGRQRIEAALRKIAL